jgi:adenylate kinase family enzyme
MQRGLIIGPCGAGKSTLAGVLGRKLALPVFHMDQLNWRPGWVESSKDELRARLAVITAGERWLIDGNYGGTLDARLARADTVVYLDYPIRLCVWRLLRRIWTYRGRTRPDMTEGCPERFDLEFFLYLLAWNTGPHIRTEARIGDFAGQIVRLKNPRALQAWLAALDESGA